MLTPRGCAATILCLALAACSGDGETDAAPAGQPTPANAGSVASLAGELGCGACHRGLPDADLVRERAPRLDDAGRRPPAGFLFRYLRDPVAQRGDIGRSRMPDFHLDTAESAALTLHLLELQGTPLAEGEGPAALRRARELAGVDAARGERIFRALNCAGCHRASGVEPWKNGPPLDGRGVRSRPDWLRRWLLRPEAVRPYGFRPGTGSRMPDFRLTGSEADSLLVELEAGLPAEEREVAARDGEAAAEAGRPERLSPYRAAKADALLRRRLPCLGCHRLAGRGGRIGPALDDVADRRPGGYVLGVIENPGDHAPGTVMPRVPMPSGRAELLASHLLGRSDPPAADSAPSPAATDSVPGEGEGARRRGYLSLVDHPIRAPEAHEARRDTGSPASPGSAPAGPGGEALYRGACAACHGVRGRANGFNARYLPVRPTPHASADLMARRTDATLFDGTHAGGRILGRSHFMPPFGASLDRDEIWALVRHIRELCDCRGPAWARDNREVPWAR